MTYREGFKQAMIELGDPEEVVEATLKQVCMVMAWPVVGEMPRETEQQFINTIKSHAANWKRLMETDPDAVRTELEKRISERRNAQ